MEVKGIVDKNLNSPNTDEKIQFFKKEIESVKDRAFFGVIFDYLTDFMLAIISFGDKDKVMWLKLSHTPLKVFLNHRIMINVNTKGA